MVFSALLAWKIQFCLGPPVRLLPKLYGAVEFFLVGDLSDWVFVL